MIIDLETLKKIKACSMGIDFFNKFYPNGAEISTIVKEMGDKIPLEMVHFIKNNCSLSEEEKELYNKLCKINNSNFIYSSSNINNSNKISNSEFVNRSELVKSSKHIICSNNIYNSNDIKYSNYIQNSNTIHNSDYVLDSSEIKESYSIYQCKNIVNSKYLSFSNDINNSYLLTLSKNSSMCGFSNLLDSCSFCLFCTNLNDEFSMMFNEPIEVAAITIYSKQITEMLKNYNLKVLEKKKNNNYLGYKLEPITYNKIFNNIPNEFWEFIKNLPNYNNEVLERLIWKQI